MEEKLHLTAEWDKTFPKSEKVNHRKVTFHNRYGITLAADLYEPKNAEDSEAARYEKRKALNAQRVIDYKNGSYQRAGGVVDPLPADAPFFVKDYHDYYKTSRGYHPRSLNSNDGWNVTSSLSFLNMPILQYSHEIRSAVLLVHGKKAHSCYFSKDAFEKLTGENKELLLIPGAVHTDLYDQVDVIPFDKMAAFFKENMRG